MPLATIFPPTSPGAFREKWGLGLIVVRRLGGGSPWLHPLAQLAFQRSCKALI